jgi:hypothetical protein
MFVKEFGKDLTSYDLNGQLENVYKWRLNLNTINESDARSTLESFNNKIKSIKTSSLSHQAERNPQFMEALLVTRVLEAWLNEQENLLIERELKKAEISKREKYVKGMKNRKADFEKRYPGRGEEVMYATATKMAKNESVEEAMDVLRGVLYGTTQLNESEVDQASAIVAARGMVDEIQKMVEKIGAMINEELPSLYDTIRDRVGAEQAQAFNSAANEALTPLMDAVKSAREAMDGAARTVAGEEPMPMSTSAEPSVEPMDQTSEPEAMPAPPEETDYETSDAATGGTQELGRGKRA